MIIFIPIEYLDKVALVLIISTNCNSDLKVLYQNKYRKTKNNVYVLLS